MWPFWLWPFWSVAVLTGSRALKEPRKGKLDMSKWWWRLDMEKFDVAMLSSSLAEQTIELIVELSLTWDAMAIVRSNWDILNVLRSCSHTKRAISLGKHVWMAVVFITEASVYIKTLLWRHNEPDGASNHQPYDCCLLNRLFGLRSKKTSKLHVTGFCAGNSPETNNTRLTSNWRRHDGHLTSP